MGEPRFEKMFKKLTDALFEMRGAEIRVLAYLLAAKNSENKIIATYSKIAKAIDCSTDAVGDVMRDLLRLDIIRRECDGVYMFNPGMVAKGKSTRIIALLDTYYRLAQYSL